MTTIKTINIIPAKIAELERVQNALSPLVEFSVKSSSASNFLSNGGPNFHLQRFTPVKREIHSPAVGNDLSNKNRCTAYEVQIPSSFDANCDSQPLSSSSYAAENGLITNGHDTVMPEDQRLRSVKKRREKVIKINPMKNQTANGLFENGRTIEVTINRGRQFRRTSDANISNTSSNRRESTLISYPGYTAQYQRSTCLPVQNSMELLPLPTEFPAVLQATKDTAKLWFFPDCSTAETRRHLEQLLSGSFLVRRNNGALNSFKLAFKSTDGSIQRAILDQLTNGFIIRHAHLSLPYPTLTHLIAVHCYCISSLPCLLRLPGYELSHVIRHPITQSVHNLNVFNDISTSEETSRLGHLSRSNSYRHSERVRKLGEQNSPSKSVLKWVLPRPDSLLPQGAACRLLYFGQFGVGNLEGPHAVRVCVDHVFCRSRQSFKPVVISFRVHEAGITMTDLENRVFTQRHYPKNFVLYIGIDALQRTWKYEDHSIAGTLECCIFGFVTRNPNTSLPQNQCHLLSEYDPNESAQVICEFTSRYLDLPTA